MTEAKLEAALAAAIGALEIGDAQVFTSLGTAEQNEDRTTPATITITASNRQQTDWELPLYDFVFTVTVTSRAELGKAAHIARATALAELLQSYCCRSGHTALSAAFTLENEFTPVYCQLGGGSNVVDDGEHTFVWDQELTIRGLVK